MKAEKKERPSGARLLFPRVVSLVSAANIPPHRLGVLLTMTAATRGQGMRQKLKDAIPVLGMGARYMGHTLYRATHATMLAIARTFAFLLLHWAKIAFLAIGIVIGHFGPGLYEQYAPWAIEPAATANHDWVGMFFHPTAWTSAASRA
jgi:hypothetical protein